MQTPNEYVKIAPGANNVAGLKAWHRLNPPLFKYYVFPNTTWERRTASLTADRVFRTRGLDSAKLTFKFWTPREMAFFITTFYPNDEEDVKVTIRIPDKLNQTWGNYEADMQRPRFGAGVTDQDDNFYDVEITFRQLKALV